MPDNKRPFRVGDEVHIKNWLHGKPCEGRVICVNRRNKYGLCIVTLLMYEDGYEGIESWTKEGTKYVSTSHQLELGRLPR